MALCILVLAVMVTAYGVALALDDCVLFLAHYSMLGVMPRQTGVNVASRVVFVIVSVGVTCGEGWLRSQVCLSTDSAKRKARTLEMVGAMSKVASSTDSQRASMSSGTQ